MKYFLYFLHFKGRERGTRCEVLTCLVSGEARYQYLVPDIQISECKIKFLDVADDSDCGSLQDVPLECSDGAPS